MQRAVDGEDIHGLSLGENETLVEFDLVLGATLGSSPAAGVVDENLSHQFSGNRDKVSTIFGGQRAVAGEAEVDLVDELGALQGVVGALGAEAAVGGLA